MEQELKKVFLKAKYESDTDLTKKIWSTIVLRKKRTIYFKLYAFSFIGIGSIVGIIPAFRVLLESLAQSGFYEYTSLAFSNGISNLAYWKEFAFSVAESLPTTIILISLSLTLTLFLSIKYLIKNTIKNQLSFSEFSLLSF